MKLEELFEVVLTVKPKTFKEVFGKVDDPYTDNFGCAKTGITSLEGCPKTFLCDFTAFGNNLYSLKHGPEFVGGDFTISSNHLKTLEFAPTRIEGSLYVGSNLLTSLHNIHKIIKHIGQYANFTINPITSHVLGLLLIDGLEAVDLDNKKVQDIINKHLAGDRDVFACQEELIEAGLDEFAQL